MTLYWEKREEKVILPFYRNFSWQNLFHKKQRPTKTKDPSILIIFSYLAAPWEEHRRYERHKNFSAGKQNRRPIAVFEHTLFAVDVSKKYPKDGTHLKKKKLLSLLAKKVQFQKCKLKCIPDDKPAYFKPLSAYSQACNKNR